MASSVVPSIAVPNVTAGGFDIKPRLDSDTDANSYSQFMYDVMREFDIDYSDDDGVLVTTPVGPYLQFVAHKDLVLPCVGNFKYCLRFGFNATANSNTSGPESDANKSASIRQCRMADVIVHEVAEIACHHFGKERIVMWWEGDMNHGQKFYADDEVKMAEKEFGRASEVNTGATSEN